LVVNAHKLADVFLFAQNTAVTDKPFSLEALKFFYDDRYKREIYFFKFLQQQNQRVSWENYK